MKSYVLIGLLFISSFAILISQPNVPRYENPQIDFKYTVVIGSMLRLENAEKLQKLAIENGYESFIAPVNVKNKQHYRVCVGLIPNFSESKKQLSIIKKDLKISNAWIWQAPQVTEMVKSEPKKIEQPKQEAIHKTPTSPKETIQKPEMKKIEPPPSVAKTELSKPETKSNLDEVQTTMPKSDIPVTTPTPPQTSPSPKVTEQPKSEPKTETQKVTEQPKSEPKTETQKVAEQPKSEPKTETQKVADKKKTQPKITQQPKQEPIKEQKNAEEQVPNELPPPVFISDTLLMDLTKVLPQLLTNIRNYEYLQANKYIHPDLHFFVIYNEETKPSVREFNSFEKFFAVFSAFTGKGTSFDFSNDIEQMLKQKPAIKPYPNYDCSTQKYNQKGLIVSTASDKNVNLLNNVRMYYRSFNQELLPEIAEKVSKVESRIQASVIDTEGSFIEGMYFGYIDGKWYLLVLDVKFRCR